MAPRIKTKAERRAIYIREEEVRLEGNGNRAYSRYWSSCNACRYPFRQLDGRMNMGDFRTHKALCPKRPLIVSERG
jgi:hypothetical protein